MKLRIIHGLRTPLLFSVFCLAAASLRGANVVSDFSAGNEGWIVVDHTFVGTNSVPSDAGLVASDTNPPTAGGKLRVWDLAGQWAWVIAPAKFQGDWSGCRSVQADITASSLTIKYAVLFWIGDGRGTACTNAAYHLFPLTNTISGQTAAYAAPLVSTNWVITRGAWSNLVTNVREFWIRTDLTDGCGGCASQETNWLDNVVLEQSWLGQLSITRQNESVLLDWTSNPGVALQKSGSLKSALWDTMPGTTGASHYEEPASNSAAFYRLFR